jgi:putative ABC transport system permease protein
VDAATLGLPTAAGTSVAQGRYLNAATARLPVAVPGARAGGLAATLLIGAAAGLLPAIRAARLSPTQALWSL